MGSIIAKSKVTDGFVFYLKSIKDEESLDNGIVSTDDKKTKLSKFRKNILKLAKDKKAKSYTYEIYKNYLIMEIVFVHNYIVNNPIETINRKIDETDNILTYEVNRNYLNEKLQKMTKEELENIKTIKLSELAENLEIPNDLSKRVKYDATKPEEYKIINDIKPFLFK
jgi:hypothetical protein